MHVEKSAKAVVKLKGTKLREDSQQFEIQGFKSNEGPKNSSWVSFY